MKNRFWNVTAGGAIAVSLAHVVGAAIALYFGKMSDTVFATVTVPVVTGWITAMVGVLNRETRQDDSTPG